MVKAACFESRRSRICPTLWHSCLKETKCLVKIEYCGEIPRLRGSMFGFRLEFCIMCHLIHLTILRRYYWPSLAYMCTKVTWNLIRFISRNILYIRIFNTSFGKISINNIIRWQLSVIWIVYMVINSTEQVHGIITRKYNIGLLLYAFWKPMHLHLPF